MQGSFPDIQGFTQLSLLAVTNNSLSGSLPASIYSPKAVQLLFYYNKFDSEIPAVPANMIATTVNFQNNMLVGTIPSSFSRFGSAANIIFDNNMLSGNLPTSFNGFKNNNANVTISAKNNALDAPIPDLFAGMDNLVKLDLSGNKITGTFPPSLGNLPRLRVLLINNNQMSGPLPDISGSAALVQFNGGGNQFCGCWINKALYATRTTFGCFLAGSSFCCEDNAPNQCADVWSCTNCSKLYSVDCSDPAGTFGQVPCTYDPNKQPPIIPPVYVAPQFVATPRPPASTTTGIVIQGGAAALSVACAAIMTTVAFLFAL